MTLCAGVCEFSHGGGCRIKLSEPLLKVNRCLAEVVILFLFSHLFNRFYAASLHLQLRPIKDMLVRGSN